jgi:transcriptional regulator with XRE-family HTH domain
VQDASWKETFPAFLRDAMRAIGMDPDTRGSIAEFARRADVPASTVSRWLSGSVQPTVPNLRDIAPIVRIRVLDLLVVAGHLSADEAGTAEEHIARTPDLTDGQRHELLGYLAHMRRQTGYYERHEQSGEAGDDPSESVFEDEPGRGEQTG